MPLMLRYVARSDVGLVREGNEDSGYAGPRLLAVADGMGGAAAGEVASSATIDELVHVEESVGDGNVLDALGAAVAAANNRIRQLVADDPEREGMGTTLTALLWTGGAFGLVHIGDSRAYLLRDGELRQLTHDHTFVQTLVDEGRITAAEAGVHPARSLILRALQGGGDPEPDLEMLEVRPGDRVLVCSDGLTAVVQDETLRDTLAGHQDLAESAGALVQLALRAGGPDNVTVIVAEVVETEAPPDADDTREAYLVGAASGAPPAAHKPPRRGPGAAMRQLLSSGGHHPPPDAQPDPEQLRYAPRPPRRTRWLRRLAIVVVTGAVLWGGATLANSWVRDQYYVGDQAGDVAVFRGVSQEIGPIRLSDLHEIAGGLPVGALPELYRAQVEETITADDLDDARRIIDNLRAEACGAQQATRAPATTPSPNPSPSPQTTPTPGAPNRTTEPTKSAGTASAGPSAGGAASPNRSSSPSPTPSPSPTEPAGYPGLDCAEW